MIDEGYADEVRGALDGARQIDVLVGGRGVAARMVAVAEALCAARLIAATSDGG